MKKSNKRLVSLFLTVAFTLSLTVGNGVVRVKAAEDVNSVNLRNVLAEKASHKFSPSSANDELNDNLPLQHNNPDEVVRVIVQLADKPVLESNSIGLKAITSKQNTIKAKASTLAGAKIRQTYTKLVNGFSMDVKRSEISKLKNISGVSSVSEARVYQPDMQYAKSLTQAYDTWRDLGLKGEGMVVAVIDTGIDATHKDMNLTDPSKAKIKDIKQSTESTFTAKVPYGHNFADNNDVVKDTTSSMHGMHVSGIVAANGKQEDIESNAAIQGVAPEAQLLAMKVFSNNPENGGAYSDDIIAAIEDSVAHGADVINMSLGSTAAFQDPNDPEQKAITNAVNNGTIVVVSAGNSYYSSYPQKYAGVVDTGLVGSPGLAHDSLQVASYENSQIVASALDYTSDSTNGIMAYFTSDVDPLGVLNGQYELVDCGLGRMPGDDPSNPTLNEFEGKDLTGKIALIKRGVTSFVLKKLNAQANGAVGAIIWNRDGDESYINMATDPGIKIPGIFVKNSDGVKLKSLLASGLKVSFNGKLTGAANISANGLSDFTSWGPTPNLDFKPEITAPGGNIWSTVNNDKYENMSGTSMASPHTAGGEALILQGIKQKNLGLSGRDLVELAKSTAINTAVPQVDKFLLSNKIDLPYSPRRQGAGMLQIENAINNNVTVTDGNNNATIALKEIKEKTTTFTIHLKNYGTTDATYTLGTYGGVLTEVDKFKGTPYDWPVNGATINFSKPTVTVPAKGQETVDVTVTIPDNVTTERFIEGFIKLQGTGVPNLGIPFMGFYGDWSKPSAMDKPMWDSASIYKMGTLLTSAGFDLFNYLGYTGEDSKGNPVVDKDKIAISPNDDYLNDDVVPMFTALRNMKEMQVEVLDKDNNVVRVTSMDTNVRKNWFGPDGHNDPGYKLNGNWAWDGKIYNPATSQYEAAPEGQYYINLKSKVDYEGASYQNLTMPVKVDLTAPELTIKSANVSPVGTYTLQWTDSDNLSGVDPSLILIAVNGKVVETPAITLNDGVYSTDLDLAEGVNKIEVLIADYAMNIGYKQFNVATGNVPFTITFDNFQNGLSVTDPYLAVSGSLTYKPGKFQIAGEDVTVNDDLTFSTYVKLDDGTNKVSVYAEDENGKVLVNYVYRVYCDTAAPEINLTSPTLDADGKAYVNTDTITVKGSVSDDTFGYKFYVNGDQKINVDLNDPDAEATVRDFEYTLPAVNNQYIELKAVDAFGHETIKNINVVVDKDAPVITVTGVEDGKSYKTDVKPEISANEGQVSSTLDGEEYDNSAVTTEGQHELIVSAVDLAGNTSTYKVNFTIDKTAPVITVTGVEDGKNYKTDVNPVISANEGQVTATLDGKEYDNSAVTAEGQHQLMVSAVDLAGNTSTYKVNFTIDKTAPVITVTGVENGKSYKTDVKPLISANEGQITSTLDGKAYDNSAVTAEGAHELVVTAVDVAGNTSTYKVNFTIDKTAPVITVTGVEDGKLYNKDVKPVVSANEGQVTATLDGKAYDNSTVTTEGKHELVVTVVDLAGNTSTSKVTFTVDKTAPVINVKSVEDGKTYDNTVKPEVTVSEGTLTMTLDGKEYKGDAITASGEHELVVDAKDEAGNATKVTVKFTVRAVLSNTSTDTAAQAIANSTEKQVNVSLDNTTTVDDSIFKAVAGQDKNVSFTVNSNNTTLTWTFNAKEIDANNIKDVDLSLNISAPSKDTIAKIDGNAQVLSFKDNGVLPAPATLKIKLDSTKMDLTKPVYFYYYNPTTKTTELIAGPLTPDKDGYVEVTIKHCSDYFFSNNDNEKTAAAVASLPKTGSMLDMNGLVGIGILLTAIGTLFVARRRRTE